MTDRELVATGVHGVRPADSCLRVEFRRLTPREVKPVVIRARVGVAAVDLVHHRAFAYDDAADTRARTTADRAHVHLKYDAYVIATCGDISI